MGLSVNSEESDRTSVTTGGDDDEQEYEGRANKEEVEENHTEQDEFGGSWFDDFEDESDVEELEGVNLYSENECIQLGSNNWNQINPGVIPPQIGGSGFSPIYAEDKVLLFGGWDQVNGGYMNQTWIFDYSENTWTNMSPAQKPSARSLLGMAAVYNTDKVILFGGNDLNGRDDETWVYDLSDNQWTKKNPLTKPEPIEWHAMATIYGDDKVVLFGGKKDGSIYNEFTFIYDLRFKK